MQASLSQNPTITGIRFVEGISSLVSIGRGDVSPGSGTGPNSEVGKTGSLV